MAGTIINCISNEEGFAKDVYEYLYSELERQQKFKEGRDLRIDSESVTLASDHGEISISETARVPKGMIKWVLESFIESDPDRYKDYGVIQFGDTFTIGKLLPADKMGIYSCEICSYSTPYHEEIYTHRMTHFGL